MSALEFVSAFFTPTYLFLFLNLIVGTIFLSSRLASHRPHPRPRPVNHALIDRVRSINLSLYKFDAHPQADPVQLQHYYPGPDHVVPNDGGSPSPSPSPPLLTRSPSLLDRLWSIDFYLHRKFENINPESESEPEPSQPHGVDPPAPLARAPSRLLERLRSMNYYYQKFEQSADHPPEDAQGTVPLERMRSIKFPSIYCHDDDGDGGNSRGKDMGHGAVRRIRSESERLGAEEEGKGRMRKTASEKSVEEVGGEEINAKADDFIQRFREQLRLQRVDSIQRFKDTMLARRAL